MGRMWKFHTGINKKGVTILYRRTVPQSRVRKSNKKLKKNMKVFQ
jgi:hypothetical protein